MKTLPQIKRLRTSLLEWYDAGGRTLPWRIRPEAQADGAIADPYAVWLSEIMLQQTTVTHATPYWYKFLKAFPTVNDLANADRDHVLTLWAGLGYYARARNLHKCAIAVRDEHNGRFPDTEAGLLKLPGIGAYTAAAIAAICYNEPTNIVDGNVERVISRLFAVESFLPKAKTELRDLAATLADPKRPGDYGQAIMDLGATVCKPKNPACNICPWAFACDAHKSDNMERYPRKLKKAALPIRFGAVFVLSNADTVLLQKRPDKGLLGGMVEFPGTDWVATPTEWLCFAPTRRNWEKAGAVTHIFTHFKLELTIYRAQGPAPEYEHGFWVNAGKLKSYALPSLMVKAAKVAGLS